MREGVYGGLVWCHCFDRPLGPGGSQQTGLKSHNKISGQMEGGKQKRGKIEREMEEREEKRGSDEERKREKRRKRERDRDFRGLLCFISRHKTLSSGPYKVTH